MKILFLTIQKFYHFEQILLCRLSRDFYFQPCLPQHEMENNRHLYTHAPSTIL